MTREQFDAAERVMLQSMQQSVHDTGHVYRVLWGALRIAKTEPMADVDVVILSALLHDIGRLNEEKTPGKGHAAVGAQMAGPILQDLGWSKEKISHVQACIRTHSYKRGLTPQTLEGKILFDADKLDLTGAVGTARALLFGAQIDEPFYLVGADGLPTKGHKTEGPSLLREYDRKLKKMEDKFYTKKARKIARKRQKTMDRWFCEFKKEINKGYNKGTALLGAMLAP